MSRTMRILNWLNGVKSIRQEAIEQLPIDNTATKRYVMARTRPLSEKIKEEYRRGRDDVLKDLKRDK